MKLPDCTEFLKHLLYLSLIPLSLTLSSCVKSPAAHHEQLLEFGTLVDIKIWGVTPEQGQAAVAKLAKDFSYMHRTWHAWKPSALGRVNQLLVTNEWFSMAPSILPLIKEGSRLSRLSDGLFNPAVGNLIRLWGFAKDDANTGPPPDDGAIELLVRQNPQMSDIMIEGIQARGKNRALALDFGGFAKGYAVDRAIEHLRELGIHNGIVNAGGDLRAIGRHGERPWRVGIRNPRSEGVLASVEIEGDESVFTSGDYERFYTHNGIRYHHIIDPRSGYPARGFSSVTIFAHEAALADAAATAIFVAGPGKWLAVARKMGVSGVMVVDTEGNVEMTPNLQSRIWFIPETKPPIQLSEPL